MAHTAPPETAYWKDKGKDPIPMKDLTEKEINDFILRMDEGIHHQREQILKRKHSIDKLQTIKEQLEREAGRRGMPLGYEALTIED